jgi:predicted amidophosphoribosyltransferase
MTLIEQAPGPVILVDDVATSGAHIEEAVKLLKPGCGAVLAVVWISGDKL